jgi:hypothetical protein
MEQPTKLITYNMHGYNQGAPYLTELCSCADVIFIQEHWLGSDDFHLLNVDSNFTFFSSSAIDSVVNNAVLVGRPFGGVSILIKNKFMRNAEVILLHEKFIIIKINELILCKAYLPCRNSSNRVLQYNDIVELIIEELMEFKSCTIIFGGDLNCDLSSNSHSSRAICKLSEALSLERTDQIMAVHDNVTFCNLQGTSSSLIDYFLVSTSIVNNVISLKTLDNGTNLSDHLPLCIAISDLIQDSLLMPLPDSNRKQTPSNKNNAARLAWRWDKANKLRYHDLTHQYLLSIDCNPTKLLNKPYEAIVSEIENLYCNITTALDLAASQSVPRKQINFYKQWWDQELNEAKQRSMAAHKDWLDDGRKRSGILFDNMKKCKYEYKLLIKTKQHDSNNKFTDELNETLTVCIKDNRSFGSLGTPNWVKNKKERFLFLAHVMSLRL